MKFDLLTVAEECYNNLQFRDDFLFCKILTERTDIAKELLELILNRKIRKVEAQKLRSKKPLKSQRRAEAFAWMFTWKMK